MTKKRIFKLVPYDEVNDVWLLKEKAWWIFYAFVSAGSKEKLTKWVGDNNGEFAS
jgi:hypothetical protein